MGNKSGNNLTFGAEGDAGIPRGKNMKTSGKILVEISGGLIIFSHMEFRSSYPQVFADLPQILW